MRLAAAVRRDNGKYPGDGVVGRELPDWYLVGNLKVESGGVAIADLGAIPGDSFRTRVPVGMYLVESKLIDFGGSFRVSRVRVRREGVAGNIGRRCAEVPVDFGAIAIGDFDTIRSRLDEEEQLELNEEARDFMSVEFCRRCAVKVGKCTSRFYVCKSGFGDGVYPVFRTRARGRVVGVEIELIRDGHVLGGERGSRAELVEEEESFDQMFRRMTGGRVRRDFALTGEQSIGLVIRQKKQATLEQIRERWKGEGRRGLPDRTLAKLCRAGKVKRMGNRAERRYSLV